MSRVATRSESNERDEARSPSNDGRDAETPAEIPGRGWIEVLKRTKKEGVADNASLLAGGVGDPRPVGSREADVADTVAASSS